MTEGELSKIEYARAQEKVVNACFGYSLNRLASLGSDKSIAHYTTAETALQIIKSKAFWLRNAVLMNDFSELEYGDYCLQQAFSDASVKELMIEVFENTHPNLAEELLANWQTKRSQIKRLTYIGSFSEIEKVDAVGRLSMWRAYGGRAGVALCLNSKLLESDSADLSVFHSPVLYGPPERLRDELRELLNRLKSVQSEFAMMDRQVAIHYLGNVIKYAVLSFKHPGFEEEQEWRMIYTLDDGESSFIRHTTTSIRGIPQVICEVPLNNAIGLNMPELDIGNIFERIVIGPCEYPDQIRMALLKAFADHGVDAPEMQVSNIPLRHQ